MTNKEIKVGNKVWIYSAFSGKEDGYIVSSVKKDKTLVIVTVDIPAHFGYKEYQIIMYGHASSSLLSGFNIKYRNQDICYTCDYSLVEKKRRIYEGEKKYRDAGYDFLRIVEYFKQ